MFGNVANKLWRYATAAFATCSFIWWVIFVGYLALNSPRQPDAVSGHVILQKLTQNNPIYVTASEARISLHSDVLVFLSMTLLFMGPILQRFHKSGFFEGKTFSGVLAAPSQIQSIMLLCICGPLVTTLAFWGSLIFKDAKIQDFELGIIYWFKILIVLLSPIFLGYLVTQKRSKVAGYILFGYDALLVGIAIRTGLSAAGVRSGLFAVEIANILLTSLALILIWKPGGFFAGHKQLDGQT